MRDVYHNPHKMPHDARGIANLILDYADARGQLVTNMAMNKIVYFAQVWSLISLNQPLVAQPFEAWQHGPIVQDVYHSFKKFGEKPITEHARRLDRITAQYVVCESTLDGNELALLQEVMNHYVSIPASKLRNMTHVVGGPWDRIWNYEGASNPGMVIPNELIADYYRTRLRLR